SSVQLMSGFMVVAGTLSIMFLLNPIMAIASLLPVPLVFALTTAISRRTRTLFMAQQNALGALNGHIEETVTGIQAVKAFGREPQSRASFAVINERLCRIGTRAQIWTGFLMPMMNVIGNLGFAAVAVTGGFMAVRGLISVGLIATFISYSRQFVRPLNDIANTWNTLMSAVAGAERVFQVLDEKEEAADAEGARELDRPKGRVEFRNVSFGYRPDVPVLREVSLEAPAGSVTAIVGRTGAGKTTIVNLLCRFYEVSKGEILIDGTDIRDYTRASLRRAFAVVLQDGWLFSGTVRENILYGRPGASEAEIRRAAALAGADHAIERLPQGYDTVLVESGANLSQGQRQLIAIARAALALPTLLVLDEATSSVDARTELRIQQGMIELMKGRTSFIIAHRLSTIRDADTVLVVDAGRIVEKGSPDELAAREGYFRKLSETQRGGIEI
ncbi:MAG: ABC transporter ATP-binding protein, partial [Spirochaetia bacterium]